MVFLLVHMSGNSHVAVAVMFCCFSVLSGTADRISLSQGRYSKPKDKQRSVLAVSITLVRRL